MKFIFSRVADKTSSPRTAYSTKNYSFDSSNFLANRTLELPTHKHKLTAGLGSFYPIF